jgi:5-methylcytosine-specific restriction endonuclease McrA
MSQNNNKNSNSNSNSKNLSDQMLTDKLLNLTVSERHTTLELLLSLAEFDNRKLFAATHSSLFSYVTQQLKMSEGEAQRRIDGARLLRSFPEFIKSYETGELNLTHASLLRRHFRTEARIQKKKLSREIQFELVQKLLGRSTREAERILVAVSSRPDLQKPTKAGEKLLKNGNYRVQFDARPELIAKSERLKEIWSHPMPGATWPELVERAFELAIEKRDPHAKAQRQQRRLKKANQSSQIENLRIGANSKNRKKQNAGIFCERTADLDIGCKSDCDHNAAQSLDDCLGQNQNSIYEPVITSCSDVAKNYDVDPITGEIQQRLPLPVNETQPEIKSQLAPTVAAGEEVATVSTADLPKDLASNSTAELTTNLYSELTSKKSRCLKGMPVDPFEGSPNIPNGSIVLKRPNKLLGPKIPKRRSRTIPSAIRHAVWLRDHGQCTFVYPNGQNCGERMGLEIDHITAFAHGGEHVSTNLRLRCRQHNAYHCVQTFSSAGVFAHRGL